MKQIIFDTNILMAIGEFKIDVFEELDKFCDFNYNLSILDKTELELKKISQEQKGKYPRYARLGLLFAKKINKIKTKPGEVDDLLVEMAKRGKIIATQDKELKTRLKKVGGKVITIRQKKKFVNV